MAFKQTPEELLGSISGFPAQGWMDTKPEFKQGNFCYPGKPEVVEQVGMPNVREWSPGDEDWKLPEDWWQIIHNAMKDRLSRYRSFKIFMDICVRCGACADKCHYFIGSGDPKNMPVLRAELMR
jgi:hypothetical protein